MRRGGLAILGSMPVRFHISALTPATQPALRRSRARSPREAAKGIQQGVVKTWVGAASRLNGLAIPMKRTPSPEVKNRPSALVVTAPLEDAPTREICLVAFRNIPDPNSPHCNDLFLVAAADELPRVTPSAVSKRIGYERPALVKQRTPVQTERVPDPVRDVFCGHAAVHGIGELHRRELDVLSFVPRAAMEDALLQSPSGDSSQGDLDDYRLLEAEAIAHGAIEEQEVQDPFSDVRIQMVRDVRAPDVHIEFAGTHPLRPQRGRRALASGLDPENSIRTPSIGRGIPEQLSDTVIVRVEHLVPNYEGSGRDDQPAVARGGAELFPVTFGDECL